MAPKEMSYFSSLSSVILRDMSLAKTVERAVKDLQTCAESMKEQVMKTKTVPKKPLKGFVPHFTNIFEIAKTLRTANLGLLPGRMPAALVNDMKTLRYTKAPKIYEASVDRCVNGQMNHYFSYEWGCAVTPQGTFNLALTDEAAIARQNDWSTAVNDGDDDDEVEGLRNRFLLPELEQTNAASTSANSPPHRSSSPSVQEVHPNIFNPDISPPHFQGNKSFFPLAHSSPPRIRDDVSALEGVGLDRYHRLVADGSKIRKPDFLVEKGSIPLVIVEDKIEYSRRAVQQLIDYMKEFREDVLHPGAFRPLGLCYVLSKSNGLRVAMLREADDGEMVGIGSEDAPPDRLFESLNWHDPTSHEVHEMLLSVYKRSLTL